MAIKEVTLVSKNEVVQVAPDNPLHPRGIDYKALSLNDSVPGPVIAIDQGDTLRITFKNESTSIQSLVFNAGSGPSRAISGNVKPGETKTWELVGTTPGAFLYYSAGDGFNGAWEHIANGCYGAIIVHPMFETPAKEFCITFGEVYNSEDKGIFLGAEGKVGTFDFGKMYYGKADLHLTNGLAYKYLPSMGVESKVPFNGQAEVFKVKPKELTRWYLVNAGPNESIAFNFVGHISNVSGEPSRDVYGLVTRKDTPWNIPPGAGIVIETVFPEEGVYIGIDHNMSHFLKGSGFAILATNDSQSDDHPSKSKVPRAGGSKAIIS